MPIPTGTADAEAAVENEREKIRAKIRAKVHSDLGLGLIPLAEAINDVGHAQQSGDPAQIEAAVNKHAAVFSKSYRAVVKQLTDFAIPTQTQTKLSGEVGTGFSQAEIAKLKEESE